LESLSQSFLFFLKSTRSKDLDSQVGTCSSGSTSSITLFIVLPKEKIRGMAQGHVLRAPSSDVIFGSKMIAYVRDHSLVLFYEYHQTKATIGTVFIMTSRITRYYLLLISNITGR
jgi:hypothetical protein